MQTIAIGMKGKPIVNSSVYFRAVLRVIFFMALLVLMV
jgi:hypothetical protein